MNGNSLAPILSGIELIGTWCHCLTTVYGSQFSTSTGKSLNEQSTGTTNSKSAYFPHWADCYLAADKATRVGGQDSTCPSASRRLLSAS